ncbi:PREDICTED: obscurin-like, partial [Tauraco erythrolophus]|uniref:obscurin-like n=1 Tax=Tauraco erythrolophus TaxID=121530 RepID=UPI00052361DC
GTSLLIDSNRLHQGKEGTTYFLVVDNAVSEDGGVYTCVAKNAGGEVLCKAELVVLEAAKKVATRRKLHSLYEVKQEIGRGCFSFVKRVVHKGNRVSCAAKFIPLRSKTKARAHQERDILASLSHDRITRLLDQFETRKTLILILELCSSEELLDRLFKKSVVTEAEVKLYIKQILEGIKYLHDNNVLHLDIKPLNILMVYPEREDLKLCDFGFAQKITPFEPQFSKYGSPEFVAPEIVSQSPVSKATDIWAVGVITYLSLTCKSPFAGENDRGTLLNIQNGEISWTIPDFVHLSEDAKDFIKGILQQHPTARPSALDCLSHKWFMHNLPLEAAHFINTKQLKFIVARSKWQRSLMCYKSILVMRSIPEILERTHDNTSLAISRHLIEESTSSSTSGSSSDNENSHFPKKRHFGSTPELHLSIFDAPSHQEPPKRAGEEKHSKISVPPVKPMRRKYASMKAEFELEEEEGKSDDGDDHRESLLGSLTKSASFDTARKPPHPAIAGASRSRSLDDYRLRASRSEGKLSTATLRQSEPTSKSAPTTPLFVEELIDQAAAVGQCVTLSCRTAAHSSLHIDWFRDGIPVRSSSRILISATLKNFQLLTILSVSAEDFGIYTCVATNSLGSASTSCIIRKAEVPPSPPPPDIVEVYEDGVQVVWKPVETNTPVHYTVQCKSEDGEWTTLASDITDCCYYAKNLSEGFIYRFRTACTSKAGFFLQRPVCPKLHAAMQYFPSAATEEESEIITPSEPFPTYQTYAFQTEIK